MRITSGSGLIVLCQNEVPQCKNRHDPILLEDCLSIFYIFRDFYELGSVRAKIFFFTI